MDPDNLMQWDTGMSAKRWVLLLCTSHLIFDGEWKLM